MNETNYPNSLSDVPTLSSIYPLRTPEGEALSSIEVPTAPVPDLLGQAVQGAHDTINQLADSAAPAIQQLGERAAAAEEAVHATAEQLRVTRDAWVESARTSVRNSPLMALAAAVTLGLVIARITR